MEQVKRHSILNLKTEYMNAGFWLVVLGAAFWGINPLFRILLLKSMTASQIVLVEHIILFFIAAPILWKNRHELAGLRLKHVGALLFISWGGSALATILFTMGLTYGHFNAVLLLQKLQPLFAILLARLLLQEKLPSHFLGIVTLALLGTYLITFGLTFPIGHWSDFVHIGSILSTAAAAIWGGSTVMGRLLLGQMKYETVTSLRFILALPLLAVITWIQGDSWTFPQGFGALTGLSANLLLSALLPGLISMMLYYRGLSSTKASVATIAELSFPMVGVFINWLVFQETISLAQVTGFLFIWSAMFIISRKSEARELRPS